MYRHSLSPKQSNARLSRMATTLSLVGSQNPQAHDWRACVKGARCCGWSVALSSPVQFGRCRSTVYMLELRAAPLAFHVNMLVSHGLNQAEQLLSAIGIK